MLKKKLQAKVLAYCLASYPRKIDVSASHTMPPRHNNRCQLNSQAAVLQGDGILAVECVVLDENRAFLHYINLSADGEYFDCTLGPAWAGSDYRLVKLLREFPNNDADGRLLATKAAICRAALPHVPAWLYKPGDLI